MRTPGTDTITVLRAARIDDRGAKIPDWTQRPATFDITGCDLQPGASVEDQQNRDGQRTAWTILAPYTKASSGVSGDDRIRFEGRDWPIIGDPEPWRHPRLGHVKILVASWRDLP